MNPKRERASQSTRTIGSKSWSFLMNAWHGRSSTGIFTLTARFFLTDVWKHECALLTRLLRDLTARNDRLRWYSRSRFSRLLQSILSHSSFSFPLIPTWLTGRTQPTPAPSSSTHTHSSQSRVNERCWSRAPDFGHWRRGSPIRLRIDSLERSNELSPILLDSNVHDLIPLGLISISVYSSHAGTLWHVPAKPSDY